jgi:hypothetical protein
MVTLSEDKSTNAAALDVSGETKPGSGALRICFGMYRW